MTVPQNATSSGYARTTRIVRGLLCLGVLILIAGTCIASLTERWFCDRCGYAERRQAVVLRVPVLDVIVSRGATSVSRIDDGFLKLLLDPNDSCSHTWQRYYSNAKHYFLPRVCKQTDLYPMLPRSLRSDAFSNYLIQQEDLLVAIRNSLSRAELNLVQSILSHAHSRWKESIDGDK